MDDFCGIREDDFRGVPFDQMVTQPRTDLPEFTTYGNHHVMFDRDSTLSKSYNFPWNEHSVKLPCSPTYVVKRHAGKADKRSAKYESQWEHIASCLARKVNSIEDVETIIGSYSIQNREFKALKSLTPAVQVDFIELFPDITKLALDLPKLFHKEIPLLEKSCSVTFSQLQIASLLANGFLCTFLKKYHHGFGSINFDELFAGNDDKNKNSRMQEKILCLLHYFRHVARLYPSHGRMVTYARFYLQENRPDWEKSSTDFSEVRFHIRCTGTIEDNSNGMVQVDFANRQLGGGCLTAGCIQEEILFVTRPELIASRLFMKPLSDYESVLITGCQRFAKHSGYQNAFAYAGDYHDSECEEIDGWGRGNNRILAIDAYKFDKTPKGQAGQFSPKMLTRELNKAFVGFSSCDRPNDVIASGNWGCGDFGGITSLKAVIQLMAAAQAKVNLVYFTFNDRALCDTIFSVYEEACKRNCTVGHLYRVLCTYKPPESNVETDFSAHLISQM